MSSHRCSQFAKDNLDVSNCLKLMILSDTLAVNGLYNTATRLALWAADQVTQTQDFLLLAEVRHCC